MVMGCLSAKERVLGSSVYTVVYREQVSLACAPVCVCVCDSVCIYYMFVNP